MTAEIAILNRHAVALAADSAATRMTSGDSIKINKSANKIFSLSKYAPVGIMIYSRADYRGIPWEVVIKQYRKELAAKTFDTLDEYAKDFLSFLKDSEVIAGNAREEDDVLSSIIIYFVKETEEIIKRTVEKEMRQFGKISQEHVNEIIENVYNQYLDKVSRASSISIRHDMSYSAFKARYEEALAACFELHMPGCCKIVPNMQTRFIRLVYDLITSDIFPAGYSGIVISGFGNKEIFPSLRCYHVGDSFLGYIQYREEISKTIDHNCIASVVPFAQADIIDMFMNGIHKDIELYNIKFVSIHLKKMIDKVCEDVVKSKRICGDIREYFYKNIGSILDIYIERLYGLRKKFYSPVVDIVSHLHPQELSRLCETLVGLTSLKREMSWDYETVAGPVDVAVITKGDGLVWIKRKHYFNPDINHHFFASYFREERSNENDKN